MSCWMLGQTISKEPHLVFIQFSNVRTIKEDRPNAHEGEQLYCTLHSSTPCMESKQSWIIDPPLFTICIMVFWWHLVAVSLCAYISGSSLIPGADMREEARKMTGMCLGLIRRKARGFSAGTTFCFILPVGQVPDISTLSERTFGGKPPAIDKNHNTVSLF